MKEKKLKLALRILIQFLAVVFGLLTIIAGEYDDSPGLQGVGMLLLLSIFFMNFKIIRRR